MDPYASAGVDEEREQDVFAQAMRPWLARTKVASPMVTHITGLASGYFATLMHIPPGPPLALTTDGVGTAIGALPPGRVPVDGSRVGEGDVILALPSSGLHSNGYSLARHVLFDIAGMTLADLVPGTNRRLDDALLEPTHVYVRAAEALWEAGVSPHGLVHISGGGLLNLARLAADVSYSLDALPPPPEIFAHIAAAGDIPAATMYATFNMGTGFCVVVSPADTQAALDTLTAAGEQPVV